MVYWYHERVIRMCVVPEPEADGPFLVIIGDPCSGLEFFGPFEDYDEAERFADDRGPTDTWTCHLQRPQNDEAADH
jgi:hypothetical protein